MRKLFAYSFALIILVCCLTSAASAAAGPKFTIDNVTAARGEQIKLVVNISENPGINAAMLYLTVPKTSDGEPVFTINSMKQGEWSNGNVAVSSPVDGIYNWANTDEHTEESGEFAVFTVTISPDAEPGDYEITLTSDDVSRDTGRKDEKGRYIFEDLDCYESTAVLTVTEEKAPDNPGPSVVIPTDKNEGETDTSDTGSDKEQGSEDKSGSDSKNSGSESSSSGKAGADISSNGKTIRVSASSDSTDSTGSSGSAKKDSTAKTGIMEGQHFYLMICLIAVAFIMPIAYQIKKCFTKDV
ncbi:MAG: hypothetical protein IJL71_00880 [Oscillospiraceae bacterium]|nr:hypothetical protein [Oscillospiraceae bacterium]